MARDRVITKAPPPIEPPRKRASRWDIPAMPMRDPVERASDPTQLLLRWTDELDDDRAVALWIGLASADGPIAQEAALIRWIEWAAVPLPLTLKLHQIARAAGELLEELATLARDATRIDAHESAERRAIVRAMRAWVRARDAYPSDVLGAVHLILRAEALGGLPPSRESDRVVLASALRRHLERCSSREAAPMLLALACIEPNAPVFTPFAEQTLDFLLLDGELHRGHAHELAELARVPAWINTVRLGLADVGRSAMRSVRMLSALAAHPDVARTLDPTLATEIIGQLERALSHGRFGVWSRAARAMGRLAGAFPDLAHLIADGLDASTPTALRRRTHAALATLASDADASLRDLRGTMLAGQVEPWQVASLALGVADLVEIDAEGWAASARMFAQVGGVETWATLLIGLREVITRHPEQSATARALAMQIRTQAEAVRLATSNTDVELVERALALSQRVIALEDTEADATPWVLVQGLCSHLGENPTDPRVETVVEELIAHADQAVATALRVLTQDQARAAARAGIVLEEVVDLVVEGDLPIVCERIATGPRRDAAVAYAEHLRRRVLKTVWTGLRRPMPSSVAWRRWLLRTAAVLPRVAPAEAHGMEREQRVREQVLDTLPCIADDTSLQQAGLQRHVLAALAELTEVLQPELHGNAPMSVLTWLAVRTGGLPEQGRTRRVFEFVPPIQFHQLYEAVKDLAAGDRQGTAIFTLASLLGTECRFGPILEAVARELADVAGRRPEAHWSGLPKLELAALAQAADELRRAREQADYALTLESPREPVPAGESLADRARRTNRALTSTSLKFVDAARRGEIAEHYVSELTTLCEAIATACGPIVGSPVRAALARLLVTVRTLATMVARESGEDVRYIARLRVLGTLASAEEGGMTNTYLAEGPAPGKRVVVKLLPWERFPGASADVARTLFEGEMHRLAPIVHPNVVSIIDAGFVSEGAYIALEHIPGASLETLLRKTTRLDLARLAPIVRDAARGLAYLHARGIVHRDIKPGNILVQLDGIEGAQIDSAGYPASAFIRSVVIDLGIATEVKRESTDSNGGLVGTPGYLAPEIARGLDLVTPALDVWALATVVFEALTGSNPYLEGDPELPTVLVRHGTMVLPLERLPEETRRPALLQLLTQAGKLDPRGRPSMQQFVERWIEATQ